MANSKPDLSPECERFLEIVVGRPRRASVAAFVAVRRGERDLDSDPRVLAEIFGGDNFNPDEPRDDRGRWTAGGSGGDPTGADAPTRARQKVPVRFTGDAHDDPSSAGGRFSSMSKEARGLLDLLRASAQLRGYLARVAKESTRVERGEFILARVHGDDPPKYKIVEEKPQRPQPDSIRIEARPQREGGNWKGATLPKCAPYGTIDMGKVAPGAKTDPDYEVQFWWHTHVSGSVTDSKGMPFTSEPEPSEADCEDSGVPGLMVRYDERTKEQKIFIIDRDGKFYDVDPKSLGGTSGSTTN